MDVTEELKRLRQQVTGCDLAAFADIGASMVLSVAHDGQVAQEDMDALVQAAKAALDSDLATDAAKLFDDNDGQQTTVTVSTPDEVRLFLRSAARPAEALVLLCRADIDLAAAIHTARDVLEQIAASNVDVGGEGA